MILRSLAARMALIFVLLAVAVMEVVSYYLSHRLEVYYLDRHREYVRDLVVTLAGQAGQVVAEGARNPAPGWKAELDRLVESWAQPGIILAITDAAGVVLSATRSDLLGSSLLGEPETRSALQGTPAERLVGGRLEEAGLAVAEPLVAPGDPGRVLGAVRALASLDEVETTVRGTRGIVLSATVAAMALAAFLSLLLARTISGPIRELTGRARLLAGGRFDLEIPVRSQDEVGELAAAFNFLTARLRRTLEEISAEKRKAEAVLTHMGDGVLAVDREGRVLVANPAAGSLLRLGGDVSGRPVEEVAGVELAAALRSALDSGRDQDCRVAERTAGPPGLVLRASVAPLRDQDGAVSGAVAILRDVSQEERLESMRREFVANVSHELRTPLTTVKSYVETLLDGEVEDRATEVRFLRTVAAEADRMTRLVNDLLTLSLLDAGRLTLERQEVHVPELVASVSEKFMEKCERKGVELRTSFGTGIPAVWADPQRLEQALANLLSNAVDFTPTGGRIEVEVAVRGEDLVVEVRDNGAGIPSADLPRVFERFYRVDKARSRELGGTGLGLSIAREIVEAHGGRIELTSRLGEGTRATILLPLGEVAAAERPA